MIVTILTVMSMAIAMLAIIIAVVLTNTDHFSCGFFFAHKSFQIWPKIRHHKSQSQNTYNLHS